MNVERDWGDIVHARKYIENVCFDSGFWPTDGIGDSSLEVLSPIDGIGFKIVTSSLCK